ncbi:type II toxin-antitoxin system Phd/YefM family antitoxin [Thioalkalivibrio sp. ALJT]|uniref:type II toxin-antitoxin system Phd/YefM family antitoxin n=1 Tax=Thioalkalivibrio sp. ALJT TaxID=1158146 RepID=UPI000367EB7A|nr:type II toxin-antitoxin system prevent-host-death family antitoxin [Thioalkalivibrio sp. ALJT]
MPEPTVSLANAKAHLSELAERAAAGESILITKRGKAVVRLSSATAPKKPIDANALRAVTDAQQHGSDEAFMRRIRDDARY